MIENPCHCEHEDCHHAYGSVPAGTRRAMYVGLVCDVCAETHYADVMLDQR